MLHEQLKADMKGALKAREEMRLTTLRGILSAFTNELVALKRKPDEILEDDAVLTVIKRAVKQRKDSIEQFEAGGRADLADKEKEELVVLEAYLPAQASRDDIEKAVDTALAENLNIDPSKSGMLVGVVMKALGGNADGTLVKEVIEAKLA